MVGDRNDAGLLGGVSVLAHLRTCAQDSGSLESGLGSAGFGSQEHETQAGGQESCRSRAQSIHGEEGLDWIDEIEQSWPAG